MWIYKQSTGELLRNSVHVAFGYSGAEPDGKNNPSMESVHNVGPIPRGMWTIAGPPINTWSHGPYILDLLPGASTDTYGRSGFLIHGNSLKDPGTASEGCIIMARFVREGIWNSGDRELLVEEK